MGSDSSRFKVLGDYLRSRRNRLQPEQAGLSGSYNQRRTPGLRREEVALLAGVSATYYTWLEQGREVTASRDIMENIGRALQLTPDENKHLMELWNPSEPEQVSSINTVLNPQWQEIIRQLAYPSFISNEKSEILAWNEAAAEILFDFDSLPALERLMLRLMFTDPSLRQRMVNWEEFARHSVAVFRTYYDKQHGEAFYKEFVERLCADSPDFKRIWELHDVEHKRVNRVYIRKSAEAVPNAYDIHSVASIAEHPDLHICVYTPVLNASQDIPENTAGG